jgi:hypothetical protein
LLARDWSPIPLIRLINNQDRGAAPAEHCLPEGGKRPKARAALAIPCLSPGAQSRANSASAALARIPACVAGIHEFWKNKSSQRKARPSRGRRNAGRHGMNQIEIWFSILQGKSLKGASAS